MFTLNHVERILSIRIPERHREVLLDPTDPIYEACDLLNLTDKEHESLLHMNAVLHDPEHYDPWPAFLVAFASNGCGDYCAYDTRHEPAGIIYVDPDRSIEENLTSEDKLQFETFEDWYEDQIASHVCQRCLSRDCRFELTDDYKLMFRICPHCGYREVVQELS